jgi:hypothetical protein
VAVGEIILLVSSQLSPPVVHWHRDTGYLSRRRYYKSEAPPGPLSLGGLALRASVGVRSHLSTRWPELSTSSTLLAHFGV